MVLDLQFNTGTFTSNQNSSYKTSMHPKPPALTNDNGPFFSLDSISKSETFFTSLQNGDFVFISNQLSSIFPEYTNTPSNLVANSGKPISEIYRRRRRKWKWNAKKKC